MAVFTDLKNFLKVILQIAVFPATFFRIALCLALILYFAVHNVPAGAVFLLHFNPKYLNLIMQ
jgi:hypothetical protein